jgi:uncharacterized protein YcbX
VDAPLRPAAAYAPPAGPHVARLWIYPIKSLGAVRLDAARVGPLGLDHDRRWMLVDADDRAVTQREHPALARFAVALDGAPDGASDGASDGAVTVTAPAGPPLRVAPAAPDAARRRVRLFDDVIEAAACGPAADAWFSTHLGAAVRLVYLPDDVVRPVDPRYADPGDRAAFADGYPVLVAAQASLDALNARLAARGAPPVGIERFRPNVLVAGTSAFAEDGWTTVAAGEVALALVKPCARCVITTVDPARGAAAGPEPLRTLAAFRRAGNKVLFAQNAVVRAAGTLRVGDAVHVTGARTDAGPVAAAVAAP